MGEYNEKLCKEHCKNVDEKLDVHDKRLNNHADRIDKLEQYRSKSEEKIDNLCHDLQGLTTTLRWFIGLLIGAFISFFFYAVQHNIFK